MIGEGVCPEVSRQRGDQICPAPSTPCPCPGPPGQSPCPAFLMGELSQERCCGRELGTCRGKSLRPAGDGQVTWQQR